MASGTGRAGGVDEDLVIGTGELTFGKLLGRGAWGEVFRGRLRNNREVAIKLLDLAGVAQASQFLRGKEALLRMAADLRGSKRVCRLLGIGVKDGKPYAVMPLFRESLARRVINQGPLKPDELLEAAVQVLEGLQDLHARWIVHGAVKPSNVLMEDSGGLVLADYGLRSVAEAMGVPFDEQSAVGGALAAQYLPPEGWTSELGSMTAASDAYAAAATLCFAASGQPPFGSKSVLQVMADVLTLKRLPKVPETVPEPLRSALRGALVSQPGERTTVAEMLRAARETRESRRRAEGAEATHATGTEAGGSEDAAVRAERRGRLIDLRGKDMVLSEALVADGPNAVITVRGGSVTAPTNWFGSAKPFALVARKGGLLRLDNVQVVASGVLCEDGGRVELVQSMILGAPSEGMMCKGTGSRVSMQGGVIKDPSMHGIICDMGSYVELHGVEISDCHYMGIVPRGPDSKVVADGCRISRCRHAHGVSCEDGGRAELRDVRIAGCGGVGVYCEGDGTSAVIRGGRIADTTQAGLVCRSAARVEMRNVEIAKSKGIGVVVTHRRSKVVAQGGRIKGCNNKGILCQDGGTVEMGAVEVSNCRGGGFHVQSSGSKAVVRGGRIAGCKEGDGVCCVDGGQAEVRDVEIANCGKYGLCSSGGSVRHSGCTFTGCGEGSRFGC